MKNNKFWNWVRNEDTGETELVFNGAISEDTWFGDEITPAMFRNELSKVNGNLTVWLNSPGGDVFAASQIYTMLKNHKGKVTVKIDGIAASAASVVAMAGDETLIAPTGMIMIHNPATAAFGNKEAMEQAIRLLDEVKESIINAYETKSHISRAKIAKMMDEETWLNAKKAQSLGLVDGILFAEKKRPEPEELDEDETEEDELTACPNVSLDSVERERYAVLGYDTAMSYSHTTTMQSLMKKVCAEHKGTPVDQLMSRLNLLKY